jgi:general secretion pathway protein G
MARKAAGEMDESGFTLIELLIVIVVLGILAGVVIFALGGVTNQSAIAACKADGATVSTALAAFNTDNPGLSASVTTADLGPTPTAGVTVVGGPFLQTWPSSSHYAFTLPLGVLNISVNTGGTTMSTAAVYTGASSTGAGSCSGILG